MTPEERARNAQQLYSSLNRSALVNKHSFEHVVASAIRDAETAARTEGWIECRDAAAKVAYEGWTVGETAKDIHDTITALLPPTDSSAAGTEV